MSKRPFFPPQGGDRKKAKLDVTISDHNFPLSQNGPSKEPEQNNWGDDNDDEILLLASQACEDVYNDISSLPDYSVCMQPASTSTQMCDPGPSTSKSTFNFKKPSGIPPSAISSGLKDKCNRISSPLPGISSKVLSKPGKTNQNDDSTNLNLICNDKIYKHSDSDLIYKQLLQLREENANLKSENGKLLEKCVTKEGEASILRTQLKTCQMAVDNARMEKIKAQEKVQMEWMEKLTAANGQVHELRTQLDFKNLEIISIKERCKMLESNKVKLTQVTVSNNDISSSQRINSSFSTNNQVPVMRKARVTSSSAQTDNQAALLKLNKTIRSEPSKLTAILPVILEPTCEQHSLLEYNEKLQKQTEHSTNKCRVYSTFHQIPSTASSREVKRCRVDMGSLYEDLTRIAARTDDGHCFSKIVSQVGTVMKEVESELELISRQMNTAFHKEMDERYIDATNNYLVVEQQDLLCARSLYKEEQAVLARRMVAILAAVIQSCINDRTSPSVLSECSQLVDGVLRICDLLDSTSCALLYSGLLLSITNLITNLTTKLDSSKTMEVLKLMISSRPMPFVCCDLLKLLRKLPTEMKVGRKLCAGSTAGNLRLDYDQGVLLYKKDSCYLQVLLKQIETALKCIEKQNLKTQAVDTTANLIALYSLTDYNSDDKGTVRCDCQLILLQVIVYALRILAVMLKTSSTEEKFWRKEDEYTERSRLVAVCRSGIVILYQCTLRDIEFGTQLRHYEGYLLELTDLLKGEKQLELYANMLSEISGSFQSSPEDSACSFHREPWINSFDNFSIAD